MNSLCGSTLCASGPFVTVHVIGPEEKKEAGVEKKKVLEGEMGNPGVSVAR